MAEKYSDGSLRRLAELLGAAEPMGAVELTGGLERRAVVGAWRDEPPGYVHGNLPNVLVIGPPLGAK